MKTFIFLMSFLWANTFSLATTKGLELPVELGSFDLSEAYINKDTFTVYSKRIAHIEEKDNKIGTKSESNSSKKETSRQSTKGNRAEDSHKEGGKSLNTNGRDIAERKPKAKESSVAIRFSSDVNKDIHFELTSAINSCEYKGGAIVTSGRRNSGYKRSLHRQGKALDFHFDEDFVDWLISESGDKWLENHNLEFYIESRHLGDKQDLPDRFKKYYRFIPWAEGKKYHIHLCMKR